jgi:hypothetical protein
MRRLHAVLAVGLVLVLGIVLGGLAYGSSSEPRITQKETIAANARFTAFKYVDVGNRGESPGDEVLFRARLRAGGSRIGYAVVVCTLTFSNVIQCDGTAKIGQRGKVTVQGAFSEMQQVHTSFAVTGGTGNFRNARGTLEVEDTAPNTAAFTFHLIP